MNTVFGPKISLKPLSSFWGPLIPNRTTLWEEESTAVSIHGNERDQNEGKADD